MDLFLLFEARALQCPQSTALVYLAGGPLPVPSRCCMSYGDLLAHTTELSQQLLAAQFQGRLLPCGTTNPTRKPHVAARAQERGSKRCSSFIGVYFRPSLGMIVAVLG